MTENTAENVCKHCALNPTTMVTEVRAAWVLARMNEYLSVALKRGQDISNLTHEEAFALTLEDYRNEQEKAHLTNYVLDLVPQLIPRMLGPLKVSKNAVVVPDTVPEAVSDTVPETHQIPKSEESLYCDKVPSAPDVRVEEKTTDAAFADYYAQAKKKRDRPSKTPTSGSQEGTG